MDAIKFTIIAIFVTSAFLGDLSIASAAVMTGTNYNIEIDSINIGGGRGT